MDPRIKWGHESCRRSSISPPERGSNPEGGTTNGCLGIHIAVWLALAAAIACMPVSGQQSLSDWSAAASDYYRVYFDQSYGYFSGTSVRLDVWQAQTKEPVPIVVYYHGGGWFFGDRTGALPYLMPWRACGLECDQRGLPNVRNRAGSRHRRGCAVRGAMG